MPFLRAGSLRWQVSLLIEPRASTTIYDSKNSVGYNIDIQSLNAIPRQLEVDVRKIIMRKLKELHTFHIQLKNKLCKEYRVEV